MADHRDERYLPFEGSGVISDWKLKLTSAVPTFDWSTITDVVLHVRYTAREGGDLLRDAALTAPAAELANVDAELPLRRAFSALHEFPTEWNTFLRGQTTSEALLKLDLSEKRFPYFARNLSLTITELQLIALVKNPEGWSEDITVTVNGGRTSNEVTLTLAEELYSAHPSGVVSYPEAAQGEWTMTIETGTLGAPSEWIDDVVVIARYQVSVPM